MENNSGSGGFGSDDNNNKNTNIYGTGNGSDNTNIFGTSISMENPNVHEISSSENTNVFGTSTSTENTNVHGISSMEITNVHGIGSTEITNVPDTSSLENTNVHGISSSENTNVHGISSLEDTNVHGIGSTEITNVHGTDSSSEGLYVFGNDDSIKSPYFLGSGYRIESPYAFGTGHSSEGPYVFAAGNSSESTNVFATGNSSESKNVFAADNDSESKNIFATVNSPENTNVFGIGNSSENTNVFGTSISSDNANVVPEQTSEIYMEGVEAPAVEAGNAFTAAAYDPTIELPNATFPVAGENRAAETAEGPLEFEGPVQMVGSPNVLSVQDLLGASAPPTQTQEGPATMPAPTERKIRPAKGRMGRGATVPPTPPPAPSVAPPPEPSNSPVMLQAARCAFDEGRSHQEREIARALLKLNGEVSASKGSAASLRQENGVARAVIAHLKEQVGPLEAKVEELKAELAASKGPNGATARQVYDEAVEAITKLESEKVSLKSTRGDEIARAETRARAEGDERADRAEEALRDGEAAWQAQMTDIRSAFDAERVRVEQLQEQLDEMHKQRQAADDSAAAQQAHAEGSIDALSQQLLDKDGTIKARDERISALESSHQSTNISLRQCQEDLTTSCQQRDAAQATADELRAKLVRLEAMAPPPAAEQVSSLQDRITELQNEVYTNQDNIQSRDDRINGLEKDTEALNKRMTEQRESDLDRIDELQLSVQSLQDALREAKKVNAEQSSRYNSAEVAQTQERDRWTAEQHNLEAKNKALESRVGGLKERLNAAEKEKTALERDLNKKVDQKQEELAKIQTELADRVEELEKTMTQLTTLEEAVFNVELHAAEGQNAHDHIIQVNEQMEFLDAAVDELTQKQEDLEAEAKDKDQEIKSKDATIASLRASRIREKSPKRSSNDLATELRAGQTDIEEDDFEELLPTITGQTEDDEPEPMEAEVQEAETAIETEAETVASNLSLRSILGGLFESPYLSAVVLFLFAIMLTDYNRLWSLRAAWTGANEATRQAVVASRATAGTSLGGQVWHLVGAALCFDGEAGGAKLSYGVEKLLGVTRALSG